MPVAPLPCLRSLFAIPEDVCYLNSAYMSALLESVRRAGETAVGLKSRPWQVKDEHWFERVEQARTLFARLIGASPNDVALVPSASYGIATAAQNVPFASGDTVVVMQDQFPSAVYPWRRKAAGAGGAVVTVSRPADHDWTPPLLDAIDSRCRVVSVPACHWSDGAQVDLHAVSARARDSGAQLVLDLSQSVGAAPLDLTAVDPDWICAPAYKWLLGPYSIGFLYAAPRHQAGVPLEENWIVRAGSEDFSRLVDYVDDYHEGARRFDMGERSNFILLPMLIAGLEQLLEWGVERIAETLRQTNVKLETIAAHHGLRALPPERRSPHILGLEASGGLPDGLIPKLAEQSVYIGLRGNTLRVAPHVHVSDADLQRFDYGLGRALAN
ncbi:MAG: aminotransferase class V-fold PLP-dependent enzyme [Deltaproteobacteria bacterium]|nr:aminotransferase class V-fold PLP-dependent enzyme [Deltaproteobacteria bacterium]MBW2360604.1 aminotransferase class V-fold PLP-dependent enzyme [Deltaproteobacteria bacterium]